MSTNNSRKKKKITYVKATEHSLSTYPVHFTRGKAYKLDKEGGYRTNRGVHLTYGGVKDPLTYAIQTNIQVGGLI